MDIFRYLSNNNGRDIISNVCITTVGYLINSGNDSRELGDSIIHALDTLVLTSMCDSFKRICMAMVRVILFVSCRWTAIDLSGQL